MKTTIAALTVAMATSAVAELPVVSITEPNAPSGYRVGTEEANGHRIVVKLHVFGQEDVQKASDFGAHQAPIPYEEVRFDQMATKRARELYDDPYFVRTFDLISKQSYMDAMKASITH
jgi:hypothetical protein